LQPAARTPCPPAGGKLCEAFLTVSGFLEKEVFLLDMSAFFPYDEAEIKEIFHTNT